MKYKKLWIWFAVVVLASFSVLGYFGLEIYRLAPPIPSRVVSTSGDLLMTGDDIRTGQQVWQAMGGQEVGSIWGHGAYVAPDWSADWLHREALSIINRWAGGDYETLEREPKAALQARLQHLVRTNTYDPATGDLVVSDERALAIREVGAHYAGLFGSDPALDGLRNAYAISRNSLRNDEQRRQMNAFFFWTSWACVTQRPNAAITYTNNWPPDELVGNRPGGHIIVWSVISFFLLLAGVGALAWYYATLGKHDELETGLPEHDPLLALKPTPSMRATLKYFWVVAALMVVQIGLGAITAHYGVEGSSFYGIPLDRWLPYSVARTWHTQLGLFWIATAWLATGLFVAPAVSGHEPKFQRFGTNFLFVCLLVIVVGSLTGEWLSIHGKMTLDTSFWFGHQGLEYVDLGRFWQSFLFVGLLVWLALVARALWPALRAAGEHRHLLALFLVASAAIAIFYAAGLMWGHHSHLSMIEYWRWWVVHLWVEGFFEVFATVVIAFLFVRMGLLGMQRATAAVLFSTIIFLGGGIIGTFHHLYFTGTPLSVLAFGSVFSALEVVPLVLMGFEGYENITLSRAQPWVTAYKWPIYCFVAVAFWNLVGAGLFGFFINPPIALYYMQGLNTTPLHAHTALFGVYGMLGIGLMLFCLRGLATQLAWKTRLLGFSFWAMNIGLMLMALLSLLPLGLLQGWASVEHGMWYARSAEFLHAPGMDTLRWLRIVGDTTFAAGALGVGWFVLGLKTGWSVDKNATR